MHGFTYSPLIHHDEIRILTLQPGRGEEDLRGSMGCIRLSSMPTTGPIGPGAVDSLQASLAGLFSQTTASPTNIWLWGQEYIGDKTELTPTKYGLKEIKKPIFQHGCRRRNYVSNEYDALSYTWGNPAKVEMIIVNGRQFGIARNLYTGLIRLRHPEEIRRLWIDAICIDQENVQERNHQVRMMQRVFSAASSVIVWLGDTEQAATSTLDMISDYRFKKQKSLFSYKETALRGLSGLFRKPWWRRIWIVQEVVAARELVIHIGRTSFPWTFLRQVCLAIRREEFTKHQFAPLLRSCGYQKFTALDSFRRSEAMPLVHLLQSTQDYEATDPRDKLYALLGMTSDVSTEDLTPDYTKPVRKVFQDLVAFMAVQRQSLDIICSGSFSGQQTGLPSWLPCWQVSAGFRSLGGKDRFISTGGNTQAVVDMSQFPRKLIVEGFLVDTIEQYGGSVTIAHECVSTIHRWQYIAAQSENYAKGAFLRVIVANEDYVGNRVTWTYEDFESFMNGFGRVYSRATQDLSSAITRAVMGRRFFITKKGRMGLAPAGIQLKDRVVMLSGCHVPLILRHIENYWVLIGEAYVAGLMDGETVWGPETRRRYQTRMFQLK